MEKYILEIIRYYTKKNLPDTINVTPNAKVICMKRFSSGVQHKRNIDDPTADNSVPRNVIV